MTVILPRDYHARTALEQARVVCITEDQAARMDIRPLRIGILNVMPKAEEYEFSLLHPLGRSVLQVEPVWIRLHKHRYGSSDQGHIDRLYVSFEDAIARQRLDGLVLTGAPVEELPFREVTYWEETQRILRYARDNIASTLGICWGALALAKMLGIEKTPFRRKLFGVFETRNLDHKHRITGDLDDTFFCPQSRHSGILDATLELERDRGNVNLLAHSGDAGYTILESADGRYLMHLGHPEYEPGRLVEEYRRDAALGRSDVAPPANVDVERPANTWRTHRNEFFSQWTKFVYETTSY